jgi:O-antigen/teichoic acid export membrane protein
MMASCAVVDAGRIDGTEATLVVNSLERQMARGALWMGLLRVSIRGISLISTVILARLLVPADFGLVAMATSVSAFLQLATAFSFDIPLIQKQDADRSSFDSAWTLNVLFHAVLSAALLLLAEPAAHFYQEARLDEVIRVLAAGFLVQGFENVGIVQFRKELDFRKDFIVMLSRKLGGFLVTIPLAFAFQSYWALVAGIVLGDVLGVALSYVLHPFRPRFSLAGVGPLLRFSKWLVLNNAINFLRLRSPDFVIGRISGSASLGLFTLAHEISTLPTTELVAPVNRAVFPGYSKLSTRIPELRKSYLNVLALVTAVALPAGLGIAAVADPLIQVVLGSKWASAAPIVSVLAIYGGINAMHANTGAVFNAIAKPHLITWLGSINVTLLLCASVFLALRYGAIGVAMAYLGTVTVMVPVIFYYACRETALRYRDLAAAIWRPMVSSLFMYALLREISATGLVSGRSAWLQLGMLVACGMVSYTVLMLILWTISGRPASAEQRLAALLVAKLRSAAHSPSVS